jgi:hypothetical protein
MFYAGFFMRVLIYAVKYWIPQLLSGAKSTPSTVEVPTDIAVFFGVHVTHRKSKSPARGY